MGTQDPGSYPFGTIQIAGQAGNSTTTYYRPSAAAVPTYVGEASAAVGAGIMARPFIIEFLSVVSAVAGTGGGNNVYSLMKNGQATGLTCTIADNATAGTTASAASIPVAFDFGDLITVRLVSGASSTQKFCAALG